MAVGHVATPWSLVSDECPSASPVSIWDQLAPCGHCIHRLHHASPGVRADRTTSSQIDLSGNVGIIAGIESRPPATTVRLILRRR
jgi:hypothetical protein